VAPAALDPPPRSGPRRDAPYSAVTHPPPAPTRAALAGVRDPDARGTVLATASPPEEPPLSMNSDSDLQIAGDILEVPHLLQAPRAHPATVAEFAGLARSLAADRSQWEHLVRYDATTRWYHRLRAVPQAHAPQDPAGQDASGYEVWLLSWVPGQGSGPHGHG